MYNLSGASMKNERHISVADLFIVAEDWAHVADSHLSRVCYILCTPTMWSSSAGTSCAGIYAGILLKMIFPKHGRPNRVVKLS